MYGTVCLLIAGLRSSPAMALFHAHPFGSVEGDCTWEGFTTSSVKKMAWRTNMFFKHLQFIVWLAVALLYNSSKQTSEMEVGKKMNESPQTRGSRPFQTSEFLQKSEPKGTAGTPWGPVSPSSNQLLPSLANCVPDFQPTLAVGIVPVNR